MLTQFNILNLTVFFFLSLTSLNTWAITENKPSDLESDLLETNKTISNWFDSVAEKIDLYLTGKTVSAKRNNSSVVVENTTYSRESDNFTNVTNISVNPSFPNLEAYWNLKFSTHDDQANSTQTDKGYVRQAPREKNYGATIGLFRKLKNIRVAFQPRIELQNPLKISHSITFDNLIDNTTYQVLPKFQLFANATKGTGAFLGLNYNIYLTGIYSIGFINEGEYEEKLNKFSVTNGVWLGQMLDDNASFTYALSLYSNNRPNYHLDGYSFSVTWFDVIYKKILDYRVGPHLDFTREEDFKGFVGLVFSLNLHF